MECVDNLLSALNIMKGFNRHRFHRNLKNKWNACVVEESAMHPVRLSEMVDRSNAFTMRRNPKSLQEAAMLVAYHSINAEVRHKRSKRRFSSFFSYLKAKMGGSRRPRLGRATEDILFPILARRPMSSDVDNGHDEYSLTHLSNLTCYSDMDCVEQPLRTLHEEEVSSGTNWSTESLLLSEAESVHPVYSMEDCVQSRRMALYV